MQLDTFSSFLVAIVLTGEATKNVISHMMKARSGRIINISSVTAKKSNTYGCAYGATKAALTSFSESLFDEVRKYGVKITSIHPDITKSNFYRNADFCQSEENDTFLTPCEIAKAVKFIINQRQEISVTDITIKPQKHKIQRKIPNQKKYHTYHINTIYPVKYIL